MSRVLILVCTYNEMESLPSLVNAIRTTVPTANILIIDDGSPDGTGAWAMEQSQAQSTIQCIVRQGKQGLGSAIKLGLQKAMDDQYDLVVNLDADFSHDPTVLSAMIESIDNPPADFITQPGIQDRNQPIGLVIGSRYIQGGGLRNCSWKRIVTSRTANYYARWLLKWPFQDCSSAYRCYRVQALRSINFNRLKCAGYGFLEELLWYLWKGGVNIVEFPIIYTERELGASKISMNEARGTLRVLHALRRSNNGSD